MNPLNRRPCPRGDRIKISLAKFLPALRKKHKTPDHWGSEQAPTVKRHKNRSRVKAGKMHHFQHARSALQRTRTRNTNTNKKEPMAFLVDAVSLPAFETCRWTPLSRSDPGVRRPRRPRGAPAHASDRRSQGGRPPTPTRCSLRPFQTQSTPRAPQRNTLAKPKDRKKTIKPNGEDA
jgi:hypothetical protein